jgi:hypothetical protein
VTKLDTNGKLRVFEGGVPVLDGYVLLHQTVCVFIVNQTVQCMFILTEICSYKRRCWNTKKCVTHGARGRDS